MKSTMLTKNRVFTAARTLIVGVAVAAATIVATPQPAQAQQIRVTGPLAGAPAVRELRLYRKLRLEVSPAVSFTLLDQYQRQIFAGARINFGITDWLAVGAWGGYGFSLSTDLTGQIQDVNEGRDCNTNGNEIDCKLTAVNLGDDFAEPDCENELGGCTSDHGDPVPRQVGPVQRDFR